MNKKFFYTLGIASLLLSGCTEEEQATTKQKTGPSNQEKTGKVVLEVLSGSGKTGYKDGNLAESNFAFPFGIALNQNGDVLITDQKNQRIRKITKDTVTTVTGVSKLKDPYGMEAGGFSDGANSGAMFKDPKGMAVDATGQAFIADSANGAIRKVDTDGGTTTFTKGLNHPSDIAIADDGTLYITETLNHRIVSIDKKGSVKVIAGGGYKKEGNWTNGGLKDGQGEATQFNEPTGIALSNDGSLIVADTGNQRIRKVTSDGTVTTLAGSGDSLITGTKYKEGGYKDGAAGKARFNFPNDVAVGSKGTIYIADTYNHAIRALMDEKEVTTVYSSPENSDLQGPTQMVIADKKQLIFTDQWSHQVKSIKLQ